MIEQDRKGFLILMALLGEAFKEEVSTERAKIYFEFMKPYTLFAVMTAIKRAIRELKFYPKVSELLEFIDPYNGYQMVESDESHKFRLKNENKQLLEFIIQISKIIGKKGESNIKQIALAEVR